MPKAIHPASVLVRPLITEKSTYLSGANKYVFEVLKSANKVQIKQAVETAFNVSVVEVNTMNVRGKMKRIGRNRGMTRDWKKAVVTLAPDDKLELFEGV
jgi:large subunit ribosomal protein L23